MIGLDISVMLHELLKHYRLAALILVFTF